MNSADLFYETIMKKTGQKMNNIIQQFFIFITATRNRTVLSIFLLHTLIMLTILIALIITGKDYADFLLRDDGYYDLAANFLKGDFFSTSPIGPGLPAIFMPIHLFPVSWHPFIRLIISQSAVFLILLVVSKLTKKYLSNKQYLFGGILIVLNPTFLHWTFRVSVDLYLALFLGCFILFFVRYFRKKRKVDLFLSFLFFAYGVLIRPSFILIPVFLLISVFLFKHYRLLNRYAIGLLILTLGVFYLNNLYVGYNGTSGELKAETGRENILVGPFFLTETIIKTGEFHKGTIDKYNINGKLVDNDYIIKQVHNFKNEHPNTGLISSVFIYGWENPEMFVTKYLLSPVFFFSLSSREFMSYLLLFVSIIWLLMSYKGLRNIYNEQTKPELLLILIILTGYFALHWLSHAYSRYSMAIIPYLLIFGGYPIETIANKLKKVLKR
jgi:4-amino-4-deoxy-L-arabinose transferase-like glycosyltransferase